MRPSPTSLAPEARTLWRYACISFMPFYGYSNLNRQLADFAQWSLRGTGFATISAGVNRAQSHGEAASDFCIKFARNVCGFGSGQNLLRPVPGL